MTFLLSEINHFGVIMASDSSETRTVDGKTTFTEVEKTHYFSTLNVGKAVRVLTFDRSGNPQRFILPEMSESESA